MEVSQTIQRFLTTAGQKREADFYLSLFSSKPPGQFATIFIASDIASNAVQTLSADLQILQELGLRPVLLIEEGAEVGALTRGESPSTSHPLRLKTCQAAKAADVSNSGFIPMVATSAASSADSIASIATMETQKVILLRPFSGLSTNATANNTSIEIIDIQRDLAALQKPGVLAEHQAQSLSVASSILAKCPRVKTVSITSAHSLLSELFTVKGAGTLVRRGANFTEQSSLASLDASNLIALFESAFGKPLLQESLRRKINGCIYSQDLLSAALVEPSPHGHYLSKFAVNPEVRGEGIGGDLFREVSRKYSPLFWRCRPQNSIHNWYLHRAAGHQRRDDWTVFWIDLPIASIADAIDYAISRPDDFKQENLSIRAL